jgi:hypothetical protein
VTWPVKNDRFVFVLKHALFARNANGLLLDNATQTINNGASYRSKKRKTPDGTASKKPGWIAWNDCEAKITVLDDLEMGRSTRKGNLSLDRSKQSTDGRY